MASTARTNLACFGAQSGTSARVNFSDPAAQSWELVWRPDRAPGWIPTDISAAAATRGKAPTKAGNELACLGVDGGQARVYCLDDMGHVWELAGGSDDGWVATDITAGAAGYPPPAGVDTTLTCFGVNGRAPHLYFLDDAGHFWELARRDDRNHWVATDITDRSAGNPPPAAPHALACYGANGRDPRVYVHDGLETGHVWELAWWDYAKDWIATDITKWAGNLAQACWGSEREDSGFFAGRLRDTLSSANADKTVRVWDADTGRAQVHSRSREHVARRGGRRRQGGQG